MEAVAIRQANVQSLNTGDTEGHRVNHQALPCVPPVSPVFEVFLLNLNHARTLACLDLNHARHCLAREFED